MRSCPDSDTDPRRLFVSRYRVNKHFVNHSIINVSGWKSEYAFSENAVESECSKIGESGKISFSV